jgi:hypothetical protein
VQLEELVFAVLAGTSPPATGAGLRVYPLLAPQNAELPRITFARVANAPVNSLSGSSGLDAVRVQVDAWAKTFLGAKELAAEVRTAMEGASFKGLLQNDFDTYEPETKTYRVSLDFRCWHRPA